MLTSFTDGATDADYVYDAFPGIRRRVKSAVDDTVTYYAFDGLNVLTDYDSDVSAQRSYVVPFLDDSLVLRTGGADYDYALDALGSVYSLVDGDESVQNDYLYEAFGSVHGTPAQNVTNRLRFTGREWEGALSLYQYRARWYAAGQGRFLTRDPFGWRMLAAPRAPMSQSELGADVATMSYLYAKNSPASLADPYGLKPCAATITDSLTYGYPWPPCCWITVTRTFSGTLVSQWTRRYLGGLYKWHGCRYQGSRSVTRSVTCPWPLPSWTRTSTYPGAKKSTGHFDYFTLPLIM